MPKTLDEFKDELLEMEKAIPVCIQKIKLYDSTYDSATGLYNEGATVIGERVRDLKALGLAGTALKDFIDDPKVKELKDHLDRFAQDLIQQYNTVKALHDSPFKKIEEAYGKWQAEIAAEIARLKKAKSKEAPAFELLEKLAEAFRANKGEPFFKFQRKGPQKFDKGTYEGYIEDEVKQVKDDREAIRLKKLLEPRKVSLVRSGSYKAYQTILEQFEKAHAAQHSPPKVKACQMEIEKQLKILEENAKAYSQYVSQFDAQLTKDKKDGTKIRELVADMVKWRDTCVKQVKARVRRASV